MGKPGRQERDALHCQLKARDGSRCFYCRRNFKASPMRRKTLDHYIPYCLWQTWELDNLVLACEGCNRSKDNVLPWPLVWLLLATAPQQAHFAPAA
ncbi:HNH endonuclease [Streptantibioticus silvisoli]|uniref:HNH endonuclease signature motif containing protein n=1 Tax=Streptantibioticus silvisoli TaxID=2705255 RepID=A0ABT6W4E3_9ACTN|nr:HNH endonuclease signature motif containing protein [Streptantibioticus silvisoli]MDI5964832.1 HNH endonuclease signature motif containing protein [Streptantibioticus silvisoli]